MTTKPITFTLAMARALALGKKRQTRRAVHNPEFSPAFIALCPAIGVRAAFTKLGLGADARPQVGLPGDRAWVREPYVFGRGYDGLPPSGVHGPARVHFLADGPAPDWAGKYRHAHFMPREWSRTLLDINGVRLERAKEISDEDIAAEGVDVESVLALWKTATRHEQRSILHDVAGPDFGDPSEGQDVINDCAPRDLWRIGWVLINGRESWDNNVWVWAYDFTPAGSAS